MKYEHRQQLTNHLNQKFMESGEVLNAYTIAEIVADFETYHNAEPISPEDLRRAFHEAADAFIDGMIENEYCTEESEDPDAGTDYARLPLETRIAQWEALRPRTIRRREIQTQLELFA